MSCVDKILERRRNSIFRAEYAIHGPELVERVGTCFCCGRSFEYLDALNQFEAYIEQRDGAFFAMNTFRDEMCADCAIRTLKNSTWMEIL